MKKVKAILHTFRISIVPNHLFYPKLLHTRTFFSLKYFSVCIIFFSTIFTLCVYTKVTPDKLTFYHNAFIKTLSSYPADAEFLIKDKKLGSSYTQPIFLWMDKPNGTKMLLFAANQHSLLTKNDSPDALIFLGAKQMRLSYKDMTTSVYYPSLEYVINKHTIDIFTGVIDQYLNNARGYFYFVFFSFLPLLYMSGLFEASLATSIFLYLLFRLFTKRVHLRKCIQVGFHASILPFMIGSALFCSFPSVHGTLTITASLVFIFQLIAIYEAYFSALAKKLSSPHHASGR